MFEETVYRFRLEERPWTVNAERSGNRWERAKKVKHWRGRFNDLCGSEQPIVLTDAVVEVFTELKGRLQDTSACLPAVKAAIDGLVDGGLFLDDTGEHIRAIVFHAPTKADGDALVIQISGRTLAEGVYTQPKSTTEEM